MSSPLVASSPRGSTDVTWPTLGRLALLGVLWGTTFPVVRMGVAAGAPPFLLVAVDLLLAAGLMAVLSLSLRSAPPTPRHVLGSMALGAMMIGGNNLFLFWGVQFTTGGVAAVVYATAPLLAVLAAFGIGAGERMQRGSVVALAVGLIGVILLGLTATGTTLVTNGWGVVALFAGAGSQAVGSVLVMKYRPSGEYRYGQSAQFAGGGLAALFVVLAAGERFVLPATAPVIASVLYFAIGSGIAGYTLYFGLLRRSGAVVANLVTYVNPLVALAVGVLVLGEATGPSELLGLGVILGALVLLHFTTRKPTAAGAPSPPPPTAPTLISARSPRS